MRHPGEVGPDGHAGDVLADLFDRLVLIGPSPCYLNDEGYVGGFHRKDIEELLAAIDDAKRAALLCRMAFVQRRYGQYRAARCTAQSALLLIEQHAARLASR